MANGSAWFRSPNVALWQQGKIDDPTFEQAQVVRARKIALAAWLMLSFVCVALIVAGKRSDHTPVALEPMLLVAGMLTVFGVALAFRIGRLAKVGARNMVLARNRARAEANPAEGLPQAPRAGATAPARYWGTYKRSLRYAFRVLGLSGVALAVIAGTAYWYDVNGYEFSPVIAMLGAALVGIVLHGLYMIVDRRVYLELSAEGVWCRAWGKERIAFNQFKAVYPRQRSLQRGVVFVPRDPDAYRTHLSFWTRLTFRSGGGVQAHARTVTLWTTQVDLPRDALLREVQAQVVRAAR